MLLLVSSQGLLNCTNLRTIRINDNKFSGPLPSALSKLNNLMILEAASNHFSGDLPAL